jgi:hypothetical protein
MRDETRMLRDKKGGMVVEGCGLGVFWVGQKGAEEGLINQEARDIREGNKGIYILDAEERDERSTEDYGLAEAAWVIGETRGGMRRWSGR